MRKIWWNGMFIVFGLLFSLPAFSQQTWERTYGGSSYDGGFSVQQTTDGGYVVAGRTFSFGNGWQAYLVKTNASGDTLWTRNFGGTGYDEGYSIQQTQDGGYVVAGFTNSFGDNNQVYLVKTNTFGDTLWTKTYGGTGDDWGNSVQQTSDSGYIVAGVTRSFGDTDQVYLIKINASGDTLWARTYGGTGSDRCYAVQQTQDGGYIVAGYTGSFGDGGQVYLIKTNASGDTLWTRNYGGTGYDEGYSVQQTTDGGYIVAGRTFSFGNYNQVYLIKTNASGDTLWTRDYGGSGYDWGTSVQQTTDGGYIIAGTYDYYGPGPQVYLVKTNSGGDIPWMRTYGGTGYDWGTSVQQTADGGYIIAGGTESFGNSVQVYLIKTDANGNVGVENNKGFEGPRGQGAKVTPNPFISFASVPGHETERFSLYDISGRKVGVYRGDRIGFGLSAGVYFLKPDGMETIPLRVVKLR